MKKALLISFIALVAIVSISGCLSSLDIECGDGSCNRLFEDAVSCPVDCAPHPRPTENCNNGTIDAGETCANCPADVKCGRGQICCNETCTIAACSTDSQCNDNNPATTDKCMNPGTCSAACSNTRIPEICGNGICSPSEDDYTCPQDCGYYEGYYHEYY